MKNPSTTGLVASELPASPPSGPETAVHPASPEDGCFLDAWLPAGLASGKIMVVGPTGAGKSSLLCALGLSDAPVSKTEGIRFGPKAIDTPGEMLDIPRLYHALITSSAKAGLVLFVADPTRKCAFPMKMAKVLRAPAVGVVTKADLASPDEVAQAKKALSRAGLTRMVVVSSTSGRGLAELKTLIAS